MADSSFDVFLPCETFPVLVRIGESNDLTKLESLMLRAIAAGSQDVRTLADLFGFPSDRMLFDALRGLWRAGHLVFNFESAGGRRVYLSAFTGRQIKAGRFEKLKRAVTGYEKRELMFDLITGHVLNLRGSPAAPAANKIIPYARGVITLEHITYDGIRKALALTLDRGKRVFEASIGFQGEQAAQQMRWVRLKVACSRDEEEKIEVRIIDSEEVPLPYGVRRAIGEHLTRVANDKNSDPHFVKRLLEKAKDPRDRGVVEVAAELDRLDELARSLAGRAPGEAVLRHREMRDKARSVAEVLADEMTAEATLKIVVGTDAHREEVTRMIDEAKEQVIISSPFINDFAWMEEPIRRSLEKGRRVIILWGKTRRGDELPASPGDEDLTPFHRLDRRVKQVVTNIKGGDAGRFFFFPERPTGTHAKVVVCDNDRVLVTSMNLLLASPSNPVEIGVLAEPPEGREWGDESPSVAVAADILTWAREIVPDSTIAEAIEVKPKRVEYPLPQPVLHPLLSPSEERPDEQPDEERRRDAMAIWAGWWMSHVEMLRAQSAPRRCARLVRDVEHRLLFEKGLKSAQGRLLVTSDQVSDDAVKQPTLKLLRKLGEGDPHVRIVFRSPLRTNVTAGEGVIDDLLAVEEAVNGAGGDLQCLRTNNHAKVLVYDETAVVSSFNFLSHSGRYPPDRGSLSAELGLILTGPSAADEVVRAVGRAFDDELRPLPVGETRTAAAAALHAGSDVGAIMEALTLHSQTAELGAALAEVFSRAEDPWALLGGVRDKLTEGVRRKVVATCLATRADEAGSAPYAEWLKYLACDAWQRGDPIETHLLLSALPDESRAGDGLPHPLVVEATATRPTAPVAGLLLEADLDGIPPGQRAALAMASVSEVVRRGSTDDAELARDILAAHLPSRWREALGHVLEFFYDGDVYEPFPHSLFADGVTGREQEQEFVNAYAELERGIDEARGRQFTFPHGTRTWEYLFHDSGIFGRLREIARRRDRGALREWLGEHRRRDPEVILDDATRKVSAPGDPLIGPPRRRNLVEDIGQIIRLARKAEKYDAPALEEGTGRLIEAAWKLSRELYDLRVGLAEEATSAVDEVARPLAASALSDMEEVMRYSAT
jgi:phosphatidylserine/phosphatidylglycerophosphate/cardiolipin synthase-like enzyme